MKIQKYILPFTLICVSAFSAVAQETTVKTTEEKPVGEEIQIVRPYKPVLADAFKLRRSPDLENLQVYRARFNYNVNDRRLELNSDINKLQSEKLVSSRPEKLLNNYIKLGAGMLSTLTAEGYVATGDDEALQAGLFFKHFGQGGTIEGQKSDQQQVTAFGKSILTKVALLGKLNFQRQGFSFYGFDPAVNTVNPLLAKQSLTILEGEGEIASNFTEDENALSFATKINLYTMKDMFEAKESILTLSANFNKRISSFNMGLAMSTEIGKTLDLNTASNNNLVRLNPYLRIQANGVKITAGLNFVQEFGALSDTKIFPAVSADLTLIPNYLQVFGEVNGDVKRNTLRDLTDFNPFLASNQLLENSIEKLNITGGIKGNGGPGFGYKIQAYSKKIGNMPLFVNRFDDVSKFDVIYDRGNTTRTGIEGSMTVQIANNLNWTGKATAEQYKPASELHSWLKPQLRLSSDLAYTIDNKLTFNASVYMQGDSKVKVYTATPSSPYVADPSIEQTRTVKAFIDLGFGVDYRTNKQFGVFVRANNFLGQKYSRFLYYPSNGMNIFGGLSYAF